MSLYDRMSISVVCAHFMRMFPGYVHDGYIRRPIMGTYLWELTHPIQQIGLHAYLEKLLSVLPGHETGYCNCEGLVNLFIWVLNQMDELVLRNTYEGLMRYVLCIKYFNNYQEFFLVRNMSAVAEELALLVADDDHKVKTPYIIPVLVPAPQVFVNGYGYLVGRF